MKSINPIYIALAMVSIVLLILLSFIGVTIWYYGFNPSKIGPTLTALGSITTALVALFATLWSNQKSEKLTRKSIEASQEAVQETLKNSLKEKIYELEYHEYKELYSKAVEMNYQATKILQALELLMEFRVNGYEVEEQLIEEFEEQKSLLQKKMRDSHDTTEKSLHLTPEINHYLNSLYNLMFEINSSQIEHISEDKIKKWLNSISSHESKLKSSILAKLNIEGLSEENQFLFKITRFDPEKRWIEKMEKRFRKS